MHQPAKVETLNARAGQENFPVALRVLPRDVRTHLQAIYGFARLTDDLGDEGSASPDERVAALDRLDADLDGVFDPGAAGLTDPVLERLAATVRECSLPEEPFRRLIEANRIDQRVAAVHDLGRAARVLHLLRGPGRPARPRRVRGLDAASARHSPTRCAPRCS